MTSTRPTPSSEKTIYFDAPIAHFHMQSQDPDKPIINPDRGFGEAELSREPTVAIGGAKPIHDGINGVYPEDFAGDDSSSPLNNITAHPNGSEGWLPAEDVPASTEMKEKDSSKPTRSSSVLRKKRPSSVASPTSASASATSLQRNRSLGAGSTRSARSVSRRSTFTNVDGKQITGSSFINGAGTTGPGAAAIADESLHQRRTTADESLNAKQKSKIEKMEAKDGKMLSKIIKKEGKVEKKALGVAINELAELQKIQQAAVKREAKAHTQHTKAVAAFTKAEAAYLEARTKFETAQALMNAEQENLDIARSAAVDATARMQEKSQEVEALRQTYGVDERERAVKIGELSSKRKSWF